MSTTVTYNNTKTLVPELRFVEFEDTWNRKKLDEWNLKVIDGDRGTNYPNGDDFQTTGYCLFMNAKNVTKTGFSFETKSFITKEKDELLRKGKLKRFDLVLTTRGSVGHIAFYDKNVKFENLRINSGMVLIRNENSEINPLFIYKNFFSPSVDKQIKIAAFGSAQPQLTVKEIVKLNLTIPSLPEQQKIARFLSAVDEKIQQLSRKKALLEQYKKGVMQQIFSQQIRFKDENGNDYRDWEEKKLNDVVEIMTDYVASGSFESLRNNVTVYDELEYALYVRLTDLRHNLKHNKLKYVDKFSYEFLSKSNLYGGELLIANIGANVGDVYMMPYDFGRATIAPNMIMIRENMKYYSSKYLFYCLNSYEGRKAVNRAISGSGQPKLSKTDFKNVKVLLPSVQEQKRIESLLTGVDIRIESVEKEISQTEAFKKGLLQKMFV